MSTCSAFFTQYKKDFYNLYNVSCRVLLSHAQRTFPVRTTTHATHSKQFLGVDNCSVIVRMKTFTRHDHKERRLYFLFFPFIDQKQKRRGSYKHNGFSINKKLKEVQIKHVKGIKQGGNLKDRPDRIN